MPKQVDHDVRREEIAAAAARVVAERGIDSLTTADLASAAGCTVGALPHYFKGKDAILLAALQYARKSVAERGGAGWLRSDGDLVEVFGAALPTDAASRRDARVWFAFFGRALHSREIAREYRERYSDLERQAAELLEDRKLLRSWDAATVLETIFACIDGIAMRALVEPRDWPAERQLAALRRPMDLLILD